MDAKSLQEKLTMNPEVPQETELAEKISVEKDSQETFVQEQDPVVYAPLNWGADLLSPNVENEMFPGFENDFPVLVNSLLESLGTLSLSKNATTFSGGESNNPGPAATSENNSSESGYYDLWKDNPWTTCCANARLWPLPKISCFSMLSSQTAGDVFFYVDGGVVNWNPPGSIKITIIDPKNCRLRYQLTRESPFSSSFICTFRAIRPGSYSVSVEEGTLVSLDVCGSPFSITVSRNYKLKATSFHVFGQTKKAWGIAYSSVSRKIYVSNRDLHQVHIYHEDGIVEKSIGTEGCKPEEFRRPTGIAVDNLNQRLVISDKDNHRICIYTLDGAFLFTFGRQGFQNGEMKYPWGVGVSPKNSVIAVADSGNHRLQLFDSNGNFLRKFSVYETKPFEYRVEFNFPRGVCFDANGDNIYVTDYNIQAVFKFNIKLTKKIRMTPHQLNLSRPQGLAIDPVGNLLICDSRNNCIRVVSPEGSSIASILGNCADSFWNPIDVAVTATGEIIVVDSNSRLGIM